MQHNALAYPVARDLRGIFPMLMIAIFILALVQPLTLAYRTPAVINNTPAAEPSLTAQLQQLFPTLASELAARAAFVPASHARDGQTIAGFAPSAEPIPPTGLQPAEQQAWLAMARRSAPDTASALTLFFPAHYNDAFVAEAPGMQVTLRALDAQAAQAQVEDGALAYRGVYQATDSLH